MNTLSTIIVIVQVLAALAIIGLVLVQHGKGADMGAAFGSGASGSLFGATGSSNFFSKSTGVAAAIFFSTTLVLSFLANKRTNAGAGVMENISAPAAQKPASAASAPAPSSSSAVVVGSSGSIKALSASATASSPTADGQANQIPK